MRVALMAFTVLGTACAAYAEEAPSACGGTIAKVCACDERYACEDDGDCECVQDDACAGQCVRSKADSAPPARSEVTQHPAGSP